MDTTYSIDGTSLDDERGRWFLERDNPFQSRPPVRSAAVSVPNRDGLIPQFNEVYDAGSLALRLIVTDNDRQGKPKGYDQLVANTNFLIGLVSVRHRLIRFERTMGGERRQAEGRLVTSIAPEMIDHRSGRLILAFELPDPLWRDTRLITVNSPTIDSGQPWTTNSLTLGGGNAPIRDALVGASGELTGLRLVDVATDRYIDLDTTSGPEQSLLIDCGQLRAWRVDSSDPFDWDLGWEVTGFLDTGPGGFSLTPTIPSGQNQSVISLRVLRNGSAGTVRVRARRAWL